MKIFSIHFYMLNDHFSPEHADAQHEGKESEDNLKYEWEDEFSINESVKSYQCVKGIYTLNGLYKDDSKFSFPIDNVTCFEVETENGTLIPFAISNDLVDSIEEQESENEFRVKVYLKDFEPYANPTPGVFIVSKQFPKELIALTSDRD